MRPLIYQSPVAKVIPFDNSVNSFAAVEVQSAIEEAKSSGVSNDRFPYIFSWGGSAENKWLDTVSGISSATTPLYIVENVLIKAISVAYEKTTRHSPQLHIDGVLTHTLTVTDAKYGSVTGLSIAVSAGSYLSVYSPPKSTGAPNPPTNEIYTVFLQRV